MTIDFTKLLGFDTVSEEFAAGVDLQNDTLGDKLGAKVGGIEGADQATKPFDLQNDTIASRLGAKMGPGEPNDPCEGH